MVMVINIIIIVAKNIKSFLCAKHALITLHTVTHSVFSIIL